MLDEVITRAGVLFGGRPAFVAADGCPLSYGELRSISEQVADGLERNHGVGPESVVALVLPSTIEYVVLFAALDRLRAVTVGVNPRLTAPERRSALGVAQPDLIVTTVELADELPPDVPSITVVATTSLDELLFSLRLDTGSSRRVPRRPDQPVAVVLTSGTTGAPKGAVFTVRQLRAIAEADWGLDRWDGGGAMLAATQFAHVGFMTKLPWYLMSGSTTYLLDHWRTSDALALIAEHQMTSVGGVAPQIALMLRDPDFDRYDLDAVETIVMGGGPSPPALVTEARARFGAAYSIRYSSTESGGIGTATAFDADDEEALLTVGRPRPGVDVRLVDERGTPVAHGDIGELCLRSPAVMSCYWRDDAATAAALRDGWLHTGDLARLDDAGCLRLAGRRREMFVRGGYNVYPMEVEAVLASDPQVDAVAVIPRPDPVMGEIGVAVVVPRPNADPPTLDDLRSRAGDRLASFKLPEALRVVDALPLTPMQKIDRAAMARAELEGGAECAVEAEVEAGVEAEESDP